jgi:hypothetical protein
MKKPGDRSGEPPAERMDKLEVSAAHSACEWRQVKTALGRCAAAWHLQVGMKRWAGMR